MAFVRRWRLVGVLLVSTAFAPSSPALAQQRVPNLGTEVYAGGEFERYLRNLQATGEIAHYPWSIRGFSRHELASLAPTSTSHPWADRFTIAAPDSARPLVRLHRTELQLIYNSAFPFGGNDGPVWSGRGPTVAAQVGVSFLWGPATLTLAPRAFYARNDDFLLAATGLPGIGAYADPRSNGIDLPQRFGDDAYARVDPGESTIRLDLLGTALGISTASQVWGPATLHPIILGNNAGGFPHAFLGTGAPLNLGIAKLHGRLVWGQLAQSDYAISDDLEDRRFMSGLVLVILPPLPGLELGLTRFFHSRWPSGGPGADEVLQPLQGFLKQGLGSGDAGSSDATNQLASVFARWVLRGSGFEMYGEYAREDHSWDLRDLILEPDHTRAYMLGFSNGWGAGERRTVVRGELLNAQISHLERVRPQGRFYTHSQSLQGHTHRGEVLGSIAAVGGAGGALALDLYHPGGRWTLGVTRLVNNDRAPSRANRPPIGSDVIYTLDAEALVFKGPVDFNARVSTVFNFNRYFERDVFNLNASAGVSWTP